MGAQIFRALFDDETAADPVPVCRPVLFPVGVSEAEDGVTIVSDTGSTKMGSKLRDTSYQREC